jgi:hypothetical protein
MLLTLVADDVLDAPPHRAKVVVVDRHRMSARLALRSIAGAWIVCDENFLVANSDIAHVILRTFVF